MKFVNFGKKLHFLLVTLCLCAQLPVLAGALSQASKRAATTTYRAGQRAFTTPAAAATRNMWLRGTAGSSASGRLGGTRAFSSSETLGGYGAQVGKPIQQATAFSKISYPIEEREALKESILERLAKRPGGKVWLQEIRKLEKKEEALFEALYEKLSRLSKVPVETLKASQRSTMEQKIKDDIKNTKKEENRKIVESHAVLNNLLGELGIDKSLIHFNIGPNATPGFGSARGYQISINSNRIPDDTLQYKYILAHEIGHALFQHSYKNLAGLLWPFKLTSLSFNESASLQGDFEKDWIPLKEMQANIFTGSLSPSVAEAGALCILEGCLRSLGHGSTRFFEAAPEQDLGVQDANQVDALLELSRAMKKEIASEKSSQKEHLKPAVEDVD